MADQVSIGQVKRDISDLVNRVAYKGERIILTSRGKPKAALVSIEDYEKLQRADPGPMPRAAWLAEAHRLSESIREYRGGKDIDVDAILDADREDRENRFG